MNNTKSKTRKTEEAEKECPGKKEQYKNSNYIIEYVVSLSGIESEKIYIKHDLLGRGGFANCYITQLMGSNDIMATKIIDKNNLKSSRSRLRLINQIKIHKTFSHPNIVQYIHHFEDYDNVYIMLELCQNQSLNQLIKERKTLTSPQIQSLLYGICNGVKYLHQKKYIHRDLKLGNIFLNQKFQIKIGDFGLTSQLQFLKQNKRTVCGTPNYIAPEVLEGVGYYFEVDIWAIGIIIYTLFYGFPPFESQNTSEIYTRIRKCQYSFPKSKNVPAEAIALIRSILVPQPERRPTIEQIIDSPFMKMGTGIPLQLPQICCYRAPTKEELQSTPQVVINSNVLKEGKVQKNNVLHLNIKDSKRDKSTMDRTVSRDYNAMVSGVELQQKQAQKQFQSSNNNFRKPKKKINGTVSASSFNEPSSPRIKTELLEHVIDFEQVDENTFYFCTNNYCFGTYEKERQICFAHIQDFQSPNINEIYQVKLYNNLFSERGVIPFANFKNKALLSIKAKQIFAHLKKQNLAQKQLSSNKFNRMKPEKLVYVIRVSQHKDMMMLKLSNKCIQLVYEPDKNGFFYIIEQKKLYYYDSLSSLAMKQLSLSNISETMNNFLKNSEKCNKIPNIQTYLPVVGTHLFVKLPIIQLKHIHGVITELDNKKNKHSRNRNSQ